jgi:hypothetical protein
MTYTLIVSLFSSLLLYIHSNKVFIADEKFMDVRSELMSRGWKMNPSLKSKMFTLKWRNYRNIDFGALGRNQIVNHFPNAYAITTKTALPMILPLVAHEEAVKFPISYDLQNPLQVISCVLNVVSTSSLLLWKAIFSRHEVWESLGDVDRAKCRLVANLHVVSEELLAKVRSWSGADGETTIFIQDYFSYLASYAPLIAVVVEPNVTVDSFLASPLRHGGVDGGNSDNASSGDVEEIEDLLRRAKTVNRNIWIVKPDDAGRGEGISLHSSLYSILCHIMKNGYTHIAQRYIDRPLLIKQKKFDIRQWVLVTSMDPLTVYMGHRYLRFCTEKYSEENLEDKFIHLSNNSVQKLNPKFDQSDIKGSMWSNDMFEAFLAESYGLEKVDMVRQDISNTIVNTLKSFRGIIEHRDNSFEWLGFDLLIDESLQVWLLEVNVSPDNSHSTEILESLVPRGVTGLCDIVLNDDTVMKERGNEDWKPIYLGHTSEERLPSPPTPPVYNAAECDVIVRETLVKVFGDS